VKPELCVALLWRLIDHLTLRAFGIHRLRFGSGLRFEGCQCLDTEVLLVHHQPSMFSEEDLHVGVSSLVHL